MVRTYSYAHDAVSERDRGEPYDRDWAGWPRKRTWRWRRQKLWYQIARLIGGQHEQQGTPRRA